MSNREGGKGLLFVSELVTNSPNSENHLWVFRIIFDLGSEPIDVRIDCAVVALVRIIPDLFKQVFSREHPPRVRCEEPQEVKLFGSQLHLAISDSYFASRGIDS